MAPRKKTYRKKQPKQLKSTNKSSYRRYLLKYAIKRKKQIHPHGTISVKKNQGVIFQKKYSAKQRTKLSDDILMGLIWLRQRWASLSTSKTNYWFTGWSNNWQKTSTKIRRSHQVVGDVQSKKPKPKSNIEFFSPLQKISIKLKRWQKKRSIRFESLLKSSLLGKKIKQKRKASKVPVSSKPNTFAKILGPFYDTFRYYPGQALVSIILFGSIFYGTYWLYDVVFEDLPDPQELTDKQLPVTTKIFSRDGEVLFRLYKEENRTIVPLQEIHPYVISATIAIEDQDFYSHHGFSIRGISRALMANYKGENIQGGSTLTQQLVKNRLLTPEKTLERKLRELILAVLVETQYTKPQILEMYLNQVAYGGATYGIEEAARRYFDKSASDLTLAESALLAGLPAAPSVYSPFGSNPELAKARQIEVLRRMVEDGYITEQQATSARLEELHFANNAIDIQAPHFVMYVKKILAEKYGEEMLYHGGLEITTTLDLDMQNQTQQMVTDEIDQLARMRISNGAALVTNPQTGEVYAMVGSRDYFDFDNDGQVNVTLRPRQPGSSIKPITYATALERGATVSTIIQDTPVTYDIAGSKPYSPKNYDGKFHGNVTLKEALASSYNIPAVKMLNQIGINTMIDKAEAMGITTWKERNRFGLSLTLGGGEVKMIDMAKVYGTFANGGYTTDINPILEIKNYKGDVLYHNSCALDGIGCFRTKTLDPRAAYLVSDILSDNTARTPAFGPQSTLYIPNQQVAVKTGTTNSLRDNWTIGYTTDKVVVVWVGNNDNTPMSYVASGITGASPIWNKIMRSLLDENNPHAFTAPRGIVKVATCLTTGTLPCGGCPQIAEQPYVLGTQPTIQCNIAQKRPDNPQDNADEPDLSDANIEINR